MSFDLAGTGLRAMFLRLAPRRFGPRLSPTPRHNDRANHDCNDDDDYQGDDKSGQKADIDSVLAGTRCKLVILSN